MKRSAKEQHAARTAQEKARQTGYEEMITGPRARTWSAQMPAYCFTELCPDPQYRPEKK